MMENQQKIVHSFSALAELGQEVANKNNFEEMIRTSLHLLLGSLAIMRGGIARYSRFGHELNFLAVRGLGDDSWTLLPCAAIRREDTGQRFTAMMKRLPVGQEVLPQSEHFGR